MQKKLTKKMLIKVLSLFVFVILLIEGPKICNAETVEVNSCDCFTGYQNWPSSTVLKTDSPWSTLLMPYRMLSSGNSGLKRYFIDVNGDGLLDYIYIDNYAKNTYVNNINYVHSIIRSCVLLNNGHGWDVAFKCYSGQLENNTVTYYGDCAQVD